MFFEGLRSERQLMRVVADRLSLRWYLSYDLYEPLPDHSSLARIRERYGLEVFRRFFERIVEECFEAGLVWGEELFFDSTKLEANAAVDSLAPRWTVEAHLEGLFEAEQAHPPQADDEEIPEKDREIAELPRSVKIASGSGTPPRRATGSPGPGGRTAPSRAAIGRAPPTHGRRRPIPTPPR
jgi:Transposase domain (DUF772)